MGSSQGKSQRRGTHSRASVTSFRRTSREGGGKGVSMKEGEMRMGSHLVDMKNMLGKGTFGEVFAGRHAKSGKPVAVKKMDIVEENSGAMALDEIKQYERLPQHPNVVQLIDYHFMDNAFWLVLEYCTEGTLQEFVCRHNPDEDARFGFMLQCARGIEHMHGAENRMVHRDIKPENIMLSRVAGCLEVKITDFGLAKDRQLASISEMRTNAGTHCFMAPEIVERKPYNELVDVFSLGLVFLSLISFKKGDSMLVPQIEGGPPIIPVGMQMITAATSGTKMPVVTVAKKSESANLTKVKSIINKMVVYDPKKRISVAEVLHMLQFVAESYVTAEPFESRSEAGEDSMVAIGSEFQGAEGGQICKSSMAPGKMLLQDILREKVREKAELVIRMEETDMLAKLLEDMPVMQMLAFALRSSTSDDSSDDSDDESNDNSDSSDDRDDRSEHFSVGEQVRIEDDLETAVDLQEGHGGWTKPMKECLGKVGVVKRNILHVIEVEFDNGQTWNFNPALLHKLNGRAAAEHNLRHISKCADSRFKGDDVVVICEDEDTVKRLQKRRWDDDMSKSLGLKAIVHRENADGTVLVECINQDKWTFHPDALEHADTDSSAIRTGSLVLVLADHDEVRKFQDDRHGDWNEAMDKVLGKAGTVKELIACDCVKVEFGERTWTMNTKALKHVATEGEMIAAVLRKLLC